MESHTLSAPSSWHRSSHAFLNARCCSSVSVANVSEYQESLLADGEKRTSSAILSQKSCVESERSRSENMQ